MHLFQPAYPHPPFVQTYYAYGSVACPQINSQGENYGHTQCLVLNIYVPLNASINNPHPVMVYIHGGAFVSGNSYDGITPKALIEKGVIVVTINYRLGIYGFLCTDSSKAPGNMGLKDQVIALRWINEHIKGFGGDKDKITVFGGNAGAVSIHLHLLSKNEKLFNRAIIQSGPATSPLAIVDVDNNVAFQMSEILGLKTDDINVALDFLGRHDAKQVTKAALKVKSNSQYSMEPLTKPCFERRFKDTQRFITENPNIANYDKAKTIPVMIGYNNQEMLLQYIKQEEEFYNAYSFRDMLRYDFLDIDLDEIADIVRHYYIADYAPGKRLQSEIACFAADFILNHPTERAIDLFLNSGAESIFFYVFSYESQSKFNMENHGIEANYLFNMNNNNNEDQLMVEKMVTLWTNFAKFGTPIPEPSILLPLNWEPVSEYIKPYLHIDKDLNLMYRPFHDRMAFWDLLYKCNKRKERNGRSVFKFKSGKTYAENDNIHSDK